MLITAARLFDGRGDSIVDDPLITVEDGRIVAVTRRAASSIDSPDLLDLGDVTVLAGLIDIHQHLNYSGRSDEAFLSHQRVMGVSKTVLLPAGREMNLPSTAMDPEECPRGSGTDQRSAPVAASIPTMLLSGAI